jgi:DNA-binding transcriptional MerR regulator
MVSQVDLILAARPLSITGAAKFLGVHPNTLRNYEKEGLLMPSFYLPKRHDRRYKIADLRAFQKKHWRRLKAAKAMQKAKKKR